MVDFDLDGTLLERDGSLSDASREGLARLAARGVELVAATGRRLHSALPLLERAGVGGACVVHNGALIADARRARPLLVRTLEPEVARRVVGAILERGLAPLVFTTAERGPGEVLAPVDAPDPTGYLAWYFEYARGHCTRVPDLRAAAGAGVLRVVTHAPREVLEELLLKVQAREGGGLRGFIQREVALPAWRAELLHPDATKWSGVLWIARRLAVEPEEIVAVGDAENDLELLRGAGLSLAAPAACAAAREAADVVVEGDGPGGVIAELDSIFGAAGRPPP
jgi:hydroxymethylpyrimidine pyrophosphatase-like HAD family hydrolase